MKVHTFKFFCNQVQNYLCKAVARIPTICKSSQGSCFTYILITIQTSYTSIDSCAWSFAARYRPSFLLIKFLSEALVVCVANFSCWPLTGVSLVNLSFAVEGLFCFFHRWEYLIDLCLRFTALTHDRYCDVVLPVMTHAQYRLRDRVLAYGGEKHPQSHFVSAAQKLGKKTVENRYASLLNCWRNADASLVQKQNRKGFLRPSWPTHVCWLRPANLLIDLDQGVSRNGWWTQILLF